MLDFLVCSAETTHNPVLVILSEFGTGSMLGGNWSCGTRRVKNMKNSIKDMSFPPETRLTVQR